MSDDGADVRRVQECLQSHSEHLIDCFHITVRVTVLQQARDDETRKNIR
jgi:hypothetical protein